MDPDDSGGRHRRRRANSAARAVLDEARRAGLVQRHLTKLRHLTDRSRTGGTGPLAEPVRPAPGGLPSSKREAPPRTAEAPLRAIRTTAPAVPAPPTDTAA
ncbi:hypothetical protein [Amycolatopsis sp. lyj-23]|uniref:hypothetical protein n=1 Tax=Amycolatopsis sp. lyj-23 TaxID=2789283 RepID=UPI0039791346